MSVFQLNSGILNALRSQAEQTMQDDVAIYNISYTYNEYGEQIPSSGLVTSSKALFAKPSEKDQEYIDSLFSDGTKAVVGRTVLLPFSLSSLQRDQILKKDDQEWLIVRLDDDLTNMYRIYTKILVARTEFFEKDRRLQ